MANPPQPEALEAAVVFTSLPQFFQALRSLDGSDEVIDGAPDMLTNSIQPLGKVQGFLCYPSY